MATWYQASEREEAARDKLYEQVSELRASLLDLLSVMRASTDPVEAVADIAWSRIDTLHNQIRSIEHRDHIIRRARAIIDGTADSKTLTGKLSPESTGGIVQP